MIFPSPHGGEGGAHCGTQWEGEGEQVSKLTHLGPLILPRLRRGPLLLPLGRRKISSSRIDEYMKPLPLHFAMIVF